MNSLRELIADFSGGPAAHRDEPAK